MSGDEGVGSQDLEMRTLLARLELLPYGSTAQWNSSGNQGKPGSKLLNIGSLGFVAHEYFRDMYAQGQTTEDRARVIIDAGDYLSNTRRQRLRVAGESEEQSQDRCVRELEGRPAGEAAQLMRKSTRWVMAARKARACDPNTGHPLLGAPAVDWETQARKLRGQGASFRAIAMRVGVDKMRVHRLFGREAA